MLVRRGRSLRGAVLWLSLAAACGDSRPPPLAPDRSADRPLAFDRGGDESGRDSRSDGGRDASRADSTVPDLVRIVSATRPVTFTHQEQPFQGFGVDTGWQPSGSAVQIRFTTSAASDVEATLPGKATLQRAQQLSLVYLGDAGAGKFKMDIGFAVSGQLKLDAAGVKWQGNLPFVPQFDLRFTDQKSFTPFVLDGATPRPVHLEASKPKQQLFSVPIPGLSICLWGSIGCAGGVVDVKAGGTVKADLSGIEIATTLSGGPTLKQISEGKAVTSPDRGKDSEQVSASYRATVTFGGIITLYPTISITTPIPGVKWDVAEFPIPVDLSTFGPLDYVWDFDPQSLTFDMK